MARHVEIVLDGETYHIPTLSNDQLERVMDVFSDDSLANHKRAFKVLPIMVEDATPAIDKVRCTADEMAEAIRKIMEASGVATTTENPPLALVPRTAAE